VRRVLTRANPEVLRKLEELRELERRLDPEAALERERRELAEEAERRAAEDKAAAGQVSLSRKARRDLRKYGVTAQLAGKNYSSRKLLSFRMLFAQTPVEESSDAEVVANMRILFLAHADHNMPRTLEKFTAYLRNSLCSGISEEQLERVMEILFRHGYVGFVNGRLTVSVE
jgi:phosphoketolase